MQPMLRSAAALVPIVLAAVAGCVELPARDPGRVAAAYAAAGRYDEAAREIELAVRSHPKDVRLRQQAARIHEQASQPAEAVGHLEIAIELAPGNAQSWILLGELENERDNVADAYVAYRRAAELAPDDIRAVSGLALAADSLGFDDEANHAYARWAELERELTAEGKPALEN
jgi:tetratricopeptide (TPR) repeat protein